MNFASSFYKYYNQMSKPLKLLCVILNNIFKNSKAHTCNELRLIFALLYLKTDSPIKIAQTRLCLNSDKLSLWNSPSFKFAH